MTPDVQHGNSRGAFQEFEVVKRWITFCIIQQSILGQDGVSICTFEVCHQGTVIAICHMLSCYYSNRISHPLTICPITSFQISGHRSFRWCCDHHGGNASLAQRLHPHLEDGDMEHRMYQATVKPIVFTFSSIELNGMKRLTVANDCCSDESPRSNLQCRFLPVTYCSYSLAGLTLLTRRRAWR